jgi:RNA polymerase sigma factor (TIGR02999 family)
VATVTQLLDELQAGNRAALDRLLPLVYDELRALAHERRRYWHGDDTLGTTALVHEAYLKLVRQDRLRASDRAHFLAVSAKAMRQILCNYAQARGRQKRGGDLNRVDLDALKRTPPELVVADDEVEVIGVLEDALVRLEQTDRRLCQVVECRFFAGLSIADTAEVLDTSPATVKRDWTLARAWLFRELQHEPPAEPIPGQTL